MDFTIRPTTPADPCPPGALRRAGPLWCRASTETMVRHPGHSAGVTRNICRDPEVTDPAIVALGVVNLVASGALLYRDLRVRLDLQAGA